MIIEQAEAPTTGKASYRLFGMLRFALALLVVLSHARSLAGNPLSDMLSPWGVGDIGVMCFFVLSGLIISEALERYYRDRTLAFLSNRLLRLMPPYLWALVFSVAVSALLTLAPPDAFAVSNLIIQPILPLLPAPPSWTHLFVRYIWAIEVEFWFYVIYGVLFRLYLRLKPGSPLVVLTFIAALLVSVIAFYLGRRTLLTFTMAPYFLLGACLYFWLSARNRLALAGAAIAALFCFAHFFLYTGKTIYGAGSGLVLFGLVGSTFLLWRCNPGSATKWLDRKLGDLSYPIYLNHYVVVVAFYAWPQRGILYLLACFAAVIAVSWVADTSVERFTRSLRDRVRGAEIRM
jgi:peptidoglycan/LPS O-acetylase OafA/YrhL